MKNQISYSLEVRERAVRLVFEQQKEHEYQGVNVEGLEAYALFTKLSCVFQPSAIA